jgi:Leucine-rich repeat (LRR) protein
LASWPLITWFGTAQPHTRTPTHSHTDTLDAQALAGQAKLETLHLDSNLITSVLTNTFADAGLVALKVLWMGGQGGSKLATIEAGAFAGLPLLEELELQGNAASVLLPNAFDGLGRLTRLNLCRNKLTMVPTESLVGLQMLEWLLLSNNEISTISAMSFKGFVAPLKKLQLLSNQLTFVEPDGFGPFASTLQSLLLKFNQIENVSATTLEQFPKLRHVEPPPKNLILCFTHPPTIYTLTTPETAQSFLFYF